MKKREGSGINAFINELLLNELEMNGLHIVNYLFYLHYFGFAHCLFEMSKYFLVLLLVRLQLPHFLSSEAAFFSSLDYRSKRPNGRLTRL